MKKSLLCYVALIFSIWALGSANALAQGSSAQMKIKGLSCPFCVYGVEKHLKKVSGIDSVKTNYKEATVHLQRTDKKAIDIQALNQAVTKAGFSVDHIRVSIQGTVTQWEGKPAIQESKTDQIFLLVEPGKGHTEETLSSKKWKTIKTLSQNRKKAVRIEGKVHAHDKIPVALAVETYKKGL